MRVSRQSDSGKPRLYRSLAEQYHSTPETQTDESYTHPEDIEHFAHHEEIERQEAEREARFQGISVEEGWLTSELPERRICALYEFAMLMSTWPNTRALLEGWTPYLDAGVPKLVARRVCTPGGRGLAVLCPDVLLL